MGIGDCCGSCEAAIMILESWLNKQGHDRCFWHPEVLQMLANVYGLKQTVPSELPPIEEFRLGCALFTNEEYRLMESDNEEVPVGPCGPYFPGSQRR